MATISNVSQFSPTQVSGCSLWLDAADANSVVLSGSNVTQWKDKSGNNNNTTATALTSTYNTNVLNGLNGIVITSNTPPAFTTNSNLVLSATNKISAFIVFNFSVQPSPGYMDFFVSLPNRGNFMMGTDASPFPYNTYINGVNDYYGFNYPLPTTVIMEMIYDNLNLDAYMNGTKKGSTLTPRTGTGLTTSQKLCVFNPLGSVLTGQVFEAIFYSRNISVIERQQIEGYLAWKWNLQASLPTTHPFYTNPFVRNIPITPIVLPFAERTNYSLVPTQISGCALWLDAADANSVVLSGSNVTQWRDKSGNTGRDATAVSNPKLSAINGVQAMNMTTASYFTGAVSITTTTLTCFAVANTTRTLPNAGVDQRLVSLANTTNVDFGRVDGTIALFNQGSSSGIAVWRTPGLIGLTPITTNTPFMAVSQYTGTNGFIWGNGTAGSTTGTASSGSFAITKYGIGNQANPTAEYWVGTIGEVIIYNIALTTTQRQQIEGYLAWKWNLQASLPSTHPFFRNPFIANLSITTPIANVYRITNRGFNPPTLPGMALWLDAADSATVIRTGSSVTRWDDKSGNNYNASAFGTPIYINNAFNNLSAIRFNGTSTYFSIPGTQLDIASEDFAIFCVLQYTPRALEIPIIGKGTGENASQQWALRVEANTNIYQPVIFKNSVSITSPIVYTTAGWTLFGGVVYRATSIQGFINGTGSPVGGTVVGTLTDTATNVQIGRGWSATRFFNSDMGEILLYKGTITAAQRQQTEGYLAWKWGLQKSLPTNHPFYLFPPG